MARNCRAWGSLAWHQGQTQVTSCGSRTKFRRRYQQPQSRWEDIPWTCFTATLPPNWANLPPESRLVSWTSVKQCASATLSLQPHGKASKRMASSFSWVFGDTSEQISALCQDAVAAGTHAACQPWLVASPPRKSLVEVMAWPQSQRASEAWGIDAQTLACYQVFPAYICCLGPCFTEHRGDSLVKAPGWCSQLSSAFQNHMVPLSRVPVWEPARPQSRPTMPDFGPFKQKPPDPDKWYTGTHQVLLWVGHPVRSQKKAQYVRNRLNPAES